MDKVDSNNGKINQKMGKPPYYPYFTNPIPPALNEFFRRTTPEEKQQLKKTFEDWQQQGIIQDVPTNEYEKDGNTRAYQLPHNIVHQEDKDRVVAAAVQINKYVDPQGHVMPSAYDLLSIPAGSKVFSTLDIKNAFQT